MTNIPPSASFPPSTDSGTQQMSAFEIDDGADVDVLENGVVAESFNDNVHSLPTPAELTGKRETDNVIPVNKRKSCLKVYVALILPLLIIIGISIGFMVGVQDFDDYEKDKNSQQLPQNQQNVAAVVTLPPRPISFPTTQQTPITQQTTVVPTESNQDRYDKAKKYLIDTKVSLESDLNRIFTGQFAALNWIAKTDKMRYSIPTVLTSQKDQDEFIARYVMAVVFYSTQGESWTNRLNFLSEKHICDWYELFASSQYNMFPRGVACNENKIPEALFLDSNNLWGTIPYEIDFVRSLSAINLDINTLTGPIPKFSQMNNLQHVSLAHNQLSGLFPLFIYELPRMETIDLSYNYLSGSIPLGSSPTLTALAVDNNILDGSIARTFGGDGSNFNSVPLNPNIEFLYLEENNFTDTVDNRFLVGLDKLRRLDISDNNLDGTLPKHLFEMKELEVLDLHDNEIGGTLPPNVNSNRVLKLKFLALQNNKISSTIPSSISKFTNLFHLDLSMNDFEGDMPPEIGNMKNLTYLFLAGNKFNPGPIPDFLSELTDLVDLSLKDTKRTGPIPSLFGDKLLDLVLLDLDNNQLSGQIPKNFGKLQQLQFLLLNNNKLTGSVPTELGDLEVLRLLFVDGNEIRGSFDDVYCNRPPTQYKPYVIADCGTDGGITAEVTCSCCFKCCTNSNPCNDEKIVPSNDPMWQFGYQRLFYTFGDRTVFFAI